MSSFPPGLFKTGLSCLLSPFGVHPFPPYHVVPLPPNRFLAAGLLGNLQQPLNINLDNTTGLTANQFSAFTPYIEFARAAYCDANKIAGWKCGGEPFPLRLCASLAYREGKKKPAMLFPVSC